jgi:hypothetical protein
MLRFALASAVLVACSSNPPPPSVDASLKAGSFGATCTTVSDTSTECDSMVCTDAFDQLGVVCSQHCTMLDATDPSCPVGSMGQKCNKKGFCRP